jgi:hypothetical protein
MFSKIRKIFQSINWTSYYNEKIFHLKADDYIQKNLFNNPKYKDKLNVFEFQAFSQNGEDGIISEIFKRIEVTYKYFVEFGVENGMENNTNFLLNGDWSGLWIEGDKSNFQNIKNNFNFLIPKGKLKILNEIVTRENIENILSSAGTPKEIDLLSIDIDGNDYWVWQAIKNFSPRVVVIEYNSHLGPEIKWVMKYKSDFQGNNSSYYGASLKSFELLGVEKGYVLVGCNFTGCNAFFVRKDLIGNKFTGPYTSENFFEPPRFFLYRTNGHPRKTGEFLNI